MSEAKTTTSERSNQMNGMLNKIVAWFRAGYPMGAPQFGYVALAALSPAGRASYLEYSSTEREMHRL